VTQTSAISYGQTYKYELSIVSYMDLLGMRDLLQHAGDEPGIIAAVLDRFRQFSEPDEPSAGTWEWKFVNFSDLVVRSVPVLSESNKKYRLGLVFNELSELARIQASLAAYKVLVRGGVTVGKISIDHGLTFGPALVKGYELESVRARFSRIVVDEFLFQEMRENPLLSAHAYEKEIHYIERIIKRDSDGLIFVDYLQYALHNADNNQEYLQFLLDHKKLAEEQFTEAAKLDHSTREYRSRLEKAQWLQRYHNSHVDTLEDGMFPIGFSRPEARCMSTL